MTANRLKIKDFSNPVVIFFIVITVVVMTGFALFAMQQFLVLSQHLAKEIRLIPGQEILINAFSQRIRGQPIAGVSCLVGAWLLLRSKVKKRVSVAIFLVLLGLLMLRLPALMLTNLTATATIFGFGIWLYCNSVQIWPMLSIVFYNTPVGPDFAPMFWSSYILEIALNLWRFPVYEPWRLHMQTGAFDIAYFNIINALFIVFSVGICETAIKRLLMLILSVTRSTKKQTVVPPKKNVVTPPPTPGPQPQPNSQSQSQPNPNQPNPRQHPGVML
ncbi:MAG: hypothetical protein AAGA83_00430 [Cyanobacteria bacterium P01_F01_bin.116]